MRKILKKIFYSKGFDFVLPFISIIIPFLGGYVGFLKSRILPASYFEYLKFRLGLTRRYWPKDKTCLVAHPRRIFVGINSKVGRPGSYIQGAGKVYIGDYVRFAPNVGILSSNHDLYNRDIYNNKTIRIGDYCWIGMNATIMAGVELGINTIVGAGAVVTKSFPEGHCVIAGNPARVIKYLDKEKFTPWVYPFEYYGYIPKNKFEKMRSKYLEKDL
ncbi:acyltransferase [Capnocytophaga canis]|uniref:acyltransferase n=1 Tax=Capnocytophaga canis TaxID=1848903 RepID=UPI00370D1037